MEEQNSETGTKLWSVIVAIQNPGEGSEGVRAKAHLYWPGRPLEGMGQTTVEPADDPATRIGEQRAAAQALSDLANRLLAATEPVNQPPATTNR